MDENSPSFYKSNNHKLSVIKESDCETSKLIISELKDAARNSVLNPSKQFKSINTATVLF